MGAVEHLKTLCCLGLPPESAMIAVTPLLHEIIPDGATHTMLFGPDARAVRTTWGGQYLLLGSIFLSYAQIAAGAVAVVLVVAVELVLRNSVWGQSVGAGMVRLVLAECDSAPYRRLRLCGHLR